MSEAGKIFMLDDDRIFLELYQHFLESKGYQKFAPVQLIMPTNI